MIEDTRSSPPQIVPHQSNIGRVLMDGLHVFVLSQFAFVQPLLDRLSRRTVYLDDQGIELATVLILVVFLCVGLPALIWLGELAAQLVGTKTRERVHGVIVVVLFAAIFLPVLKLVKFLPGTVLIALSIASALLAGFAYWRTAAARHCVTFAAPALLVFPLQFLAFSPATRYLFPKPEAPRVPLHVDNPVPIVLLVFDEFCGTSLMNQHGEIDRVRYPHFAALSDTATWYRNASTVHPRTEMAVPALLTGNYPRGRRPATVAEYPANLFTLLEATGKYEFVVFEPYTRLCQSRPEEKPIQSTPARAQWHSLATTLPLVYLEHLFPTDVPFQLPFVPMEWNAVRRAPPNRPEGRTGVFRYHWNSGREEQFNEFLRRITNDPLTLYFGHIVVPHSPWCFLPSGQPYTPDNGRLDFSPPMSTDLETYADDELSVLHGYQRYLLQVGYADHLLGKLMERLRAANLFDPSLLIVVADHGVSFRPGLSRRIPNDESLPDVVSIPCFVKRPGQKSGATNDRNVELIDILPTIVEVIELAEPPDMDGQSLNDPALPERSEKVFHNDSGIVTMPGAFARKAETLDRMIAFFGDGSKPNGLFQIGPHIELLGRPIEELPIGNRADVGVRVAHPAMSREEFAGVVPCYFVGRVDWHGAPASLVDLAIAVNGTIQAVTRTYSEQRINNVWTAMVPDSSLDQGLNRVEVFVVENADQELVLRPALDSPLEFESPTVER